MRKFVLLFAVLFASLWAVAQQVEYYVNGQKVSPEVARSVPVNQVDSMKKSVENGVTVLRIGLKEGAKIPEATVTADPQRTQESMARAKQMVKQMLEQEYDRSTLLKQGDRAADFTAARFEGDSVSLASLRGKVVLINFWATWCKPCLQELEHLPEAVLAQFADNPDFVFLPVAYTDSEATLTPFFSSERGRTTYAYLRGCTAMDTDKTVFGLYATKGVPRTVVVGRDGVILYGSLGNTQEGLEALAAAIGKGLGD